MNLVDFEKKVNSLDVGKMLDRAVLESKEDIIDANTAQLAEGKYASGGFLPDYALDEYAEFKIAIGSKAPKGTPDLHVEGDFYEAFEMEIGFGKNYALGSTDEKAAKLEKQYGFDIYGIPNDDTEVIPLILESLQNNLRNELL